MVDPLSAGIAAAANIAGGLMGSANAASNNRTQIALANQNAILQRQFAEHSIQWKTEDALRSGIHPLYALGAQTHSFTPVSVGLQEDPLPKHLAAAGQDVSRAINATRNAPARDLAYTQTMQSLGVQRAELENQLLASQIAKINQAGGNPPMPTAGKYLIDGQPQSGQVSNVPLERIAPPAGAPNVEPGSIVDAGFARTSTGHAVVPSKDVKERIEDQFLPEIEWFIRNRVLPTIFHSSQTPPQVDPGPNKVWIYNSLKGEYQAVERGSRSHRWFGQTGRR